MANIASARKRARQAINRRSKNYSQRSLLRTTIKKVLTAIEGKDKEAATRAYKEAVPVIDRMVNKNIIHKNKAARHKKQLNAGVRAL